MAPTPARSGPPVVTRQHSGGDDVAEGHVLRVPETGSSCWWGQLSGGIYICVRYGSTAVQHLLPAATAVSLLYLRTRIRLFSFVVGFVSLISTWVEQGVLAMWQLARFLLVDPIIFFPACYISLATFFRKTKNERSSFKVELLAWSFLN